MAGLCAAEHAVEAENTELKEEVGVPTAQCMKMWIGKADVIYDIKDLFFINRFF